MTVPTRRLRALVEKSLLRSSDVKCLSACGFHVCRRFMSLGTRDWVLESRRSGSPVRRQKKTYAWRLPLAWLKQR